MRYLVAILVLYDITVSINGQSFKIGNRQSRATTSESVLDLRQVDHDLLDTTESAKLTTITNIPTNADITKATTTTSAKEITKAPATTTSTTTTTMTMLPATTVSTLTETKTEFKACCKEECLAYENPWQMIGLACCDQKLMNPHDNICCGGKAFNRRMGSRHYDRCCGNVPYGRDQTCCQDKVYDGAGQSCCGDVAYYGGGGGNNRPWNLCCGGLLHALPIDDDAAARGAACCGRRTYDGRSHSSFCCGGAVYSRDQHFECCLPPGPMAPAWREDSGAEGFQVDTQMCCNGVHNLTMGQVDACCYVFDHVRNSEPTPTPYSADQQCCSCVSGVTKRDEARAGRC